MAHARANRLDHKSQYRGILYLQQTNWEPFLRNEI